MTQQIRALFPTTAAVIDSVLATEAFASTVIDSGRYVFHGIPAGSYFIWGIQPRGPSDDLETHWWAPVIVGATNPVSRDLDGNESGSGLYCGAY